MKLIKRIILLFCILFSFGAFSMEKPVSNRQRQVEILNDFQKKYRLPIKFSDHQKITFDRRSASRFKDMLTLDKFTFPWSTGSENELIFTLDQLELSGFLDYCDKKIREAKNLINGIASVNEYFKRNGRSIKIIEYPTEIFFDDEDKKYIQAIFNERYKELGGIDVDLDEQWWNYRIYNSIEIIDLEFLYYFIKSMLKAERDEQLDENKRNTERRKPPPFNLDYEKIKPQARSLPGKANIIDAYVTDILPQCFRNEAELIEAIKNNDEELKKWISGNPVDGYKFNNFNCGVFEQVSIQELRNARDKIPKPAKPGHFHVIEGVNTDYYSWFRHLVDVAALQADKENAGAVFQLASNFNGLEVPNSKKRIVDLLLTNYVNDKTQGPSAAISASAAALWRRYFMFYDPNTNPSRWPQNEEHQINFLDGVNHKITVNKAGYVCLSEQCSSPTEEDYLTLKIGYNRNVQVINGFRINDDKHLTILGEPHLVSQALCSAIDWETNRSYRGDPNPDEWGKMLVRLSYEATLLKAYLEKAPKVYLTMVGGGVFDNPFDWIFEAIEKKRDFIQESGMEVFLVLRSDDSKSFEFNSLRPKLLQLVQETNGSYVQYQKESIGRYPPKVN